MLELCSITWQISIALLRYFCLFVLFVCGFTSLSKIFHSYGEVTSTGERLQMLTYAWYSWQLRSEGSLAIRTYCDMGYPFIMVTHQDPWHSHLLPIVCQWSCHYFFQRLKTTSTGDRSPIIHMQDKNSTTKQQRRLVRWNQNIA